MRGRKPQVKNQKTQSELSCPVYITPAAKREWKRVYQLLCEAGSPLTDADAAVLAGYAQAFARWIEAEAAVTLHGVVLVETSTSREGKTTTRLRKNPAVTASKEAQNSMLRYIAALGLSPADRARLGERDVDDSDELKRLLTPPPLEQDDE